MPGVPTVTVALGIAILLTSAGIAIWLAVWLQRRRRNKAASWPPPISFTSASTRELPQPRSAPPPSPPPQSEIPRMTHPTIAFCTTCKGRAEHVMKTLPFNLSANTSPQSKFILLLHTSDSHLLRWMAEDHACLRALSQDRLAVYTYDTPGPFHVAHTKNMAHRLGILEGADVLVMQDADNFTGPSFDAAVLAQMAEPGVFLCPDFDLIRSIPWGPGSPRPLRGFAGRLAMRSQDFVKAGGYDEAFAVWGSEDTDMLGRLVRMGYTMRHIDNSHLIVIPHSDDVRFREYPEAAANGTKAHIAALGERTSTVVNYGHFGCGEVRRLGGDAVTLGPLPTRVFGIGMHKTATSSLHRAFQVLGFDALHWGAGEAPLIWHEMAEHGRSATLERYYALSDLPIPLLYRQLDVAYPGSKFILTIRDESRWLRSVERMWDSRYNNDRWIWDHYPFTNTIHQALYGRTTFDAATMLATYRRHNAEVVAYFAARPDDLLIMDMDEGDGWDALCGFLGFPIPPIPYPRTHVTRGINCGVSL
jgi:hypothetical protein